MSHLRVKATIKPKADGGGAQEYIPVNSLQVLDLGGFKIIQFKTTEGNLTLGFNADLVEQLKAKL